MLLFIVLISLLIVSILLFLLSMFFEPLYCMDCFEEARRKLLNKISKVEGNIEYFSEQVEQADHSFKKALKDNLPEDEKQGIVEAMKESQTNLNLEKKALKILKSRLESGNYDSSLSTTSSLGKRNFAE